MQIFNISTALIAVAVLAAIVTYNRLSGRNLIQDCWDKLRLTTRSVDVWDAHWAANRTRSDIVICLTTLPSRINKIDATLKSLLYQTRAPARIRLHVPDKSRREGVAYEVPAWLEGLESVEVVRCSEDWGPATKLIPALKETPADQRLLVVVDDKLYAPDLVESMHQRSAEQPDVAFGSSGWVVPNDFMHRKVTSLGNLRGEPPSGRKATAVRAPTQVDILQGYSGYLVRPSFFDLDALLDGYDSAPPEAFFVDDVWISGYCRVPKWVMPARRFCFVSWLRASLHDRTSLGQREAETDPEQPPNTIIIRHPHDRWLTTCGTQPDSS